MEISVIEKSGGKFLVNAKFAGILEENRILSPDDLWNLNSEPVKAKLRERGTARVILDSTSGKVEAFIKRFAPLPIKEYFKALTSLKPVFADGAFHEWEAMLEFHRLGLPAAEPIACARTGKGTCILSLGIQGYRRLSDVFAENADSGFKVRRGLVRRIAEIAAKIHSAGLAHQDFYLLHFFLTRSDDRIYVIDLQRVIIQKNLSRRWRVKDLAQLHFSATGLVRRTDLARFWRAYSDICGGNIRGDRGLVRAILSKSARIRSRVGVSR